MKPLSIKSQIRILEEAIPQIEHLMTEQMPCEFRELNSILRWRTIWMYCEDWAPRMLDCFYARYERKFPDGKLHEIYSFGRTGIPDKETWLNLSMEERKTIWYKPRLEFLQSWHKDLMDNTIMGLERYIEENAIYLHIDVRCDSKTLIPCRVLDRWKPVIDVRKSKIVNWKNGKTATIHCKVCDDCTCYLTDERGTVISFLKNSRAPKILNTTGDASGDYISLNVMEDGTIENFDASPDKFNYFQFNYFQYKTIMKSI